MNATLMKRLFRVIQSGSTADVEVLCRRIVEEEKKQGHGRVAKELEQILIEKQTAKPAPQTGTLQRLPTSRRDSAPLIHE